MNELIDGWIDVSCKPATDMSHNGGIKQRTDGQVRDRVVIEKREYFKHMLPLPSRPWQEQEQKFVLSFTPRSSLVSPGVEVRRE